MGFLAGDGHNLAHLLGREGGRSTRTWQVRQPLLGRSMGIGLKPSTAPQSDPIRRQFDLSGNGFVGLPLGSEEHNTGSAHQTLR